MARWRRCTQCLFHALDRWAEEGGYLVLRRSVHWPVPHVLHVSERSGLTHYAPPDKLRRPWHSVFGFRGAVVFGDSDPAPPMSRTGVVLGALILLVLGSWWAIRRGWRRATC